MTRTVQLVKLNSHRKISIGHFKCVRIFFAGKGSMFRQNSVGNIEIKYKTISTKIYRI